MSERHDPPSGRNPEAAGTGIIRRAPTGSFPAAAAPPRPAPARPAPPPLPPLGQQPAPVIEAGAAAPIAACAVAIISGWATAVVSTDLMASWWHSDQLFCLAVGFLSLVFAAATVTGVILLLRRRLLGAHLVAIGAVVALLMFGSLFLAGARVPWIVHTIPLAQIISAVLALHPATRRWLERG